MINDFFINLLLLVSMMFIGGHLSKDTPFDTDSGIVTKTFLGIGGGVLAIFMMIYSIKIEGTTTLIDLRIIALMSVFYIGGLLPAVITGIITVVFRSLYYGFNQSAVVAIIQVVALLILYSIINGLKYGSLKKWIVMYAASIIVLFSTWYYLLFNVSNLISILMGYMAVATIAAILAYSLLRYVKLSNELYRRYKNEATKDFLTGLSNTRQFDKIFDSSAANAKEKGEKLACLMIDIDHFKNVNDTFGHAVGDIVLRELAAVLKKTCRIFDIVSRVGGEEFCVLLINCSQERAAEIGKQICDEVKNHKFDIGDNRSINITVSVGAATYPDTIDDSEMLLKQADDSLYKAKQTGRNRVCTSNTCEL
ncbi:MAG: GGDEF domain-containing protein [Bacillota bacterium]|nr:GGDEF domain-containing protein [Bacillota bacterium]